MGTSTDQARQAVAATRGRAEATAERLEARLRDSLDPRQRLRRDGTKLAAGLAAVALVGVVYAVRARRRGRALTGSDVDWVAEMPQEWRERLRELLADAVASGRVSGELKSMGRHRQRSLGASLALRAIRMAAPVIISAAAQRIGHRQAGSAPGETHHT